VARGVPVVDARILVDHEVVVFGIEPGEVPCIDVASIHIYCGALRGSEVLKKPRITPAIWPLQASLVARTALMPVALISSTCFQTLLAKDLGLPTGFLSEILNNKKLLPARHRTTLANLCHQWLMALPEKTAAVEAFGKAWRERRYT
jgi:hypothetical protein